jgi:hypothetical protein
MDARPRTPAGALKHVSVDGVDGRTRVGVQLRRVRDDLVAVLVQAIGSWLLNHEGDLVRDGELLPVVMQFSALQDSLARMLSTLGMQKRAKAAVQSLDTYLARASTDGSTQAE